MERQLPACRRSRPIHRTLMEVGSGPCQHHGSQRPSQQRGVKTSHPAWLGRVGGRLLGRAAAHLGGVRGRPRRHGGARPGRKLGHRGGLGRALVRRSALVGPAGAGAAVAAVVVPRAIPCLRRLQQHTYDLEQTGMKCEACTSSALLSMPCQCAAPCGASSSPEAFFISQQWWIRPQVSSYCDHLYSAYTLTYVRESDKRRCLVLSVHGGCGCTWELPYPMLLYPLLS